MSNEVREAEQLKWKQEWFDEWCKLIEDHKLTDLFKPVPEHFGFKYTLDDYHEGISCHFIIERGAPVCVKILFWYANMAHERTSKVNDIYATALNQLSDYGYDLIIKPSYEQ